MVWLCISITIQTQTIIPNIEYAHTTNVQQTGTPNVQQTDNWQLPLLKVDFSNVQQTHTFIQCPADQNVNQCPADQYTKISNRKVHQCISDRRENQMFSRTVHKMSGRTVHPMYNRPVHSNAWQNGTHQSLIDRYTKLPSTIQCPTDRYTPKSNRPVRQMYSRMVPTNVQQTGTHNVQQNQIGNPTCLTERCTKCLAERYTQCPTDRYTQSYDRMVQTKV